MAFIEIFLSRREMAPAIHILCPAKRRAMSSLLYAIPRHSRLLRFCEWSFATACQSAPASQCLSERVKSEHVTALGVASRRFQQYFKVTPYIPDYTYTLTSSKLHSDDATTYTDPRDERPRILILLPRSKLGTRNQFVPVRVEDV